MQVAIVGCGVIGAYLGWKLSNEHLVTIFEQKNKIGKESCSGLISERLWEFIPKNNKLIKGSVKTGDLCFPKRTIQLQFIPKMLIINRPKLDKYVANLARDNNVHILRNHKVTKIFFYKESRPQLSYIYKKKQYLSQYDAVIGCDGPLSLIREQMKLGTSRKILGIFCYKKAKADKLTIWPLKNGFKWSIPRGYYTEYGVLERPEIAKKEFKKFNIKAKVYSGLVPQGLASKSKQNIAICGDAVGLTKPWSGGGVIWGLTAANLLLKTFPDFKKYSNELEKFFGPRILFSKLITKLVVSTGFKTPGIFPKQPVFDGDWLL